MTDKTTQPREQAGGQIPKTKSKNYEIWRSMRQRCRDPKHRAYHRYGGRGIAVCERWLTYENFVEDMGERPDGMTLDRIDNDIGYCKENCRWATYEEQNRNKRHNKLNMDMAIEIAVMRLRGNASRIIGEKFGICAGTVVNIAEGSIWRGALEAAKKIIGASNEPQPE